MAKVQNPLFGDFREAFSNLFVFQNNGSSTPIARVKVKHPQNPRSAHYPTRLPGWTKAMEQHAADNAAPEDTVLYVSRYALAPTRPTNARTTALQPTEGNPATQDFSIAWSAPTTKYRGHVLDNLQGYFVEITQDLIGWTRCNAEPVELCQYSGVAPAGDVYFIVLAVDTEGNVSTPSPIAQLIAPPVEDEFEEAFYNERFYGEEE